jgi:hypothetical protein
MKIRYYIAYLLLAVMMVVAAGITVFLLFRAYNVSVNLGLKYLEFIVTRYPLLYIRCLLIFFLSSFLPSSLLFLLSL